MQRVFWVFCRRKNWNKECILFLLLLLPSMLCSQDSAVPNKKQISFLFKVLSYDRNLIKQDKGKIDIAVLYWEEDGQGKAVKEAVAIATAFERAARAEVQDVFLTARDIAFKSSGDLQEQIDANGINVLYVHSSMTTALVSVQQVTRRKKVLTLSGNRKFIERGLSLGVYIEKQIPVLAVNIRAGKLEGLDLDPAIMLVATIIK